MSMGWNKKSKQRQEGENRQNSYELGQGNAHGTF